MPRYTDAEGNEWNIEDWPGHSYKATVINHAYRSSNFWVVSVRGTNTVMFQCYWCRKLISSPGVEGDHVVQRSLGASADPVLNDLFADAESSFNPDGSSWNLVLSCSECNGGSRNKSGRMTRSDFRKDRDKQGPSGSGSGSGSSTILSY